MLPEVGGTELLVIAAVALIVIGPKDLPPLMRKIGQLMGRLRGMAAEFRTSFDDMARQSELDDLRKEVDAMRAERLDPVQMTHEAFSYQDPVMRALPESFDAATPTVSAPVMEARLPLGEPEEPTLFDLDAPETLARH